MKLFSKLKDYNSELEEILDKKTLSSNIKSLLLSMVYKIESSYKDYSEVKRNVKTKESFLEEIVESIKLYCDNIKYVEPNSKEAELLKSNNVLALTNEKERSILCYPTEVSLLFAISEITPKYFYISNDFMFKKVMQIALADGYCLNNLEILTSFNGWSWDVNKNQNINYINNLIYQNLLIILGDDFLTQWRLSSSSKRDFLEELKMYVKSITGTNSFFYKLCSVIYKNADDLERKNIEKLLKQKAIELKKMQDKEKFLNDCQKAKQKLTKLVEKIDFALNDENILIKEFKKRNSKLDDDKKIATIKIFENMMKRERETYINEISQISYLLKPSNFIKRKNELEQYEKILKNNSSIDEEIVELEKEFLIFLNKKVNKVNTRDEIIDIIYELRYLKNIPIKNGKLISEIEILNNAIDRILKKVVTLACKIGIIKIISMDIALNYEIIKYALDTKIIELEGIKLFFEKQEGALIIKIFDKEVFEKQGKKKVDLKKDILEVKFKKYIKLFS